MLNTAAAQIDLDAIRHNLQVVRMLCPASRIMAMVKADAYGHGLLQVAEVLDAADGLAAARLTEALLLRQAGIRKRILLLATLLDESALRLCAEQKIDVTAHDKGSVTRIATQAKHTPLRVWLELDSGMHRAGLDPKSFIEADQLLSTHAGVTELTHMTHFSNADEQGSASMRNQIACFAECRGRSSASPASLSNSAALISSPETHADWVRPGIMLYGVNPLGASGEVVLRPAMRVCARIISIRDIEAGETVGYNQRWTSARPSRIAVVGIGYGDGYPRHAPNGTPVWINGRFAPIVGQVSMDSLTIDLTDGPQATVGDEVVLWGEELPVSTVAKCAATIAYELFTSLTDRVDRSYH